MKDRTQAAKDLLNAGWTLDEVNNVLTPQLPFVPTIAPFAPTITPFPDPRIPAPWESPFWPGTITIGPAIPDLVPQWQPLTTTGAICAAAN